ncbi:MAG TPA: hypothetical protein VNN80_19840 [Polyangiaceae bacterium]|jgi:hypothetical protein|nr:hypothetical protein [Polyangiaceae bacterium]
MRRVFRSFGWVPFVLLGAFAACSSADDSSDQVREALQQDVVLQASDFGCIKDWPQVRDFRITNKLGQEADSVARANAPGEGDYPVGTVIQVVPVEAMVKRAPGFSPESNDWEFFLLDVTESGTTITSRGVADVVGPGGNCLDCHAQSERKWDLVCERDHGCGSIPVTPEFLLMLQDTDPRCSAP